MILLIGYAVRRIGWSVESKPIYRGVSWQSIVERKGVIACVYIAIEALYRAGDERLKYILLVLRSFLLLDVIIDLRERFSPHPEFHLDQQRTGEDWDCLCVMSCALPISRGETECRFQTCHQ